MRPLSRLGLRFAVRAHLRNEINRLDGEQRSAVKLVYHDSKLLTRVMNHLQENVITADTPAVPDPNQEVPVKHPFLKFLFDHREEILAFIMEIVKLFGGGK